MPNAAKAKNMITTIIEDGSISLMCHLSVWNTRLGARVHNETVNYFAYSFLKLRIRTMFQR